MCFLPKQLCWTLKSCICPSINLQSKTPQELCGQECPVRWQQTGWHQAGAPIPHSWIQPVPTWTHLVHSCMQDTAAAAAGHSARLMAAPLLPASSPVLSHHLPAAPAYAQGPPAAAAPAPTPWVPRVPFPLLWVSSTQTPTVCADVPRASGMGDCLRGNFKPGWTLLIWNEFTGLDFLASSSLSLTLFLCRFDLRPLLALTWIDVRLIHVTYWCASHPHTFNARGRQASLRTWSHRLKKTTTKKAVISDMLQSLFRSHFHLWHILVLGLTLQ